MATAHPLTGTPHRKWLESAPASVHPSSTPVQCVLEQKGLGASTHRSLLPDILSYLGPAVRDCHGTHLVSSIWQEALDAGNPWKHILCRSYPSFLPFLPPPPTVGASSRPRRGTSSTSSLLQPWGMAKELLRLRLLGGKFPTYDDREQERHTQAFRGLRRAPSSPRKEFPLGRVRVLRPFVAPIN